MMSPARASATFGRAAALCLLLLSTPCFSVAAAPAEPTPQKLIGGVPPEEALRLGEKMYIEGILPSGEPMQGMVQGDIPVDGSTFTCANCHQRSGFGSAEGWVRTSPIDGKRLYSPLSKFKGIPLTGKSAELGKDELYRPAYTDESLAKAMMTGEDPGGRQFNDAMPKYFLNEKDMAVMVYYLKNLSAGTEPGVTDNGIHFATIVTDGVTREDREAMLRPLRLFIENFRLPYLTERMVRGGSSIREGGGKALRKLSLTVWELKGPAATWEAQLEEYYRKDPAFAVLGGIAAGDWEPIHRFCERRKIPAIFPITDYPVVSGGGWYTLYLSKGLYQEGATAAKYLAGPADLPKEQSVVQVFRGGRAGQALSKAFDEAWAGLGRKPAESIAVGKDEPLTPQFWKSLFEKHQQAVLLLWLEAADFPGNLAGRTGMVFASSTLLGRKMFTLPAEERASVYLTYPYALPQEAGNYGKPMDNALKKNDGPRSNLFIDYKMQVFRMVMTGPLSRMRSLVYRDYFLELIDSTQDLSTNPAPQPPILFGPGKPYAMTMPIPYPRLSFGQGQRYASKGCYVVQLSEGQEPRLVDKSGWITY